MSSRAGKHNEGLLVYTNTSLEGIASKRRARETLRVGDVVRYTYSGSLMVIVRIGLDAANDTKFLCHYLFPSKDDSHHATYVFHSQWERVGHIDLNYETLVAWGYSPEVPDASW